MAVFPLTPRPLSPEERLAFGVCVSSYLVPPVRRGGSCEWCESTAADRAAADVRRGERCDERCNWYEGQLKETILSQPLADSSLCGGSLLEALRKAAMTVQTRHGRFAIC